MSEQEEFKPDPFKSFVDKDYDPENDPYKDTHYPPAPQSGNRLPIATRNAGGRRLGTKTDRVKTRKLELMLDVSHKDLSADPIPTNTDGAPSFDGVLQETLLTDGEARQMLRMAVRTLLIKACTGDTKAIFELAKRLDGQAKMKTEITAKVDKTATAMDQFTPDELEKFVKNNRGNVIDAQPINVEYLTHQEPKEPTFHDLQERRRLQEAAKNKIITTDDGELMLVRDE